MTNNRLFRKGSIQIHFLSIVLLLPRYVFDENGINLTLQAAGAVIRDSFNDLGTRGCQIADRCGDIAPSLNIQTSFCGLSLLGKPFNRCNGFIEKTENCLDHLYYIYKASLEGAW
jgi:hypothetical protein